MALLKTLARSFAGGEIAPELYGRIDLSRFQTGLARCENMIPLPHGPVVRRKGTSVVHFEAQSLPQRPRIIPFDRGEGDEILLVLLASVVRFVYRGTPVGLPASAPAWQSSGHQYYVGDFVTSSGNLYFCREAHASGSFSTDESNGKWYLQSTGFFELPHPFSLAQAQELDYVQSGDVMTMVHPEKGIQELMHGQGYEWAFSAVPTGMAITDSPPTGLTVSPDHNYPSDPDRKTIVQEGERDYEYAVTAVFPWGETATSSSETTTNNLTFQGAYNDLSWSAVTDASAYNVYKMTGGTFAFIGQAPTPSFRDDNITGDPLKTPPVVDTDLNSGTGHYPRTACYFEQRRWFGGTLKNPQVLYATVPGGDANMAKSRPTTADSSIEVELAATRRETIHHIVPLSDLIVLTSNGEWRVGSGGGEAVTPLTISAKTQGYAGASPVKPVVTPNTVLYAQRAGGKVREIKYSEEQASFRSADMTLMAPHLFEGVEAVSMALQKSPFQILWVLRSDGRLLSFTYLPEQEVYAWAQHWLGGEVKALATVAEGAEDILYVVVSRKLPDQGTPYLTLERMASFADDQEAVGPHGDRPFWDGEAFLDGMCAKEDVRAFSTVSGLHWLEGLTVGVRVDGAVHRPLTVESGEIGLDEPANKVEMGVISPPVFITLPFASEQMPAFGQGSAKSPTVAHLRVRNTTEVLAGPNAERLAKLPVRDVRTPYDTPPAPTNGVVTLRLPAGWDQEGQLYVTQEEPHDLQISSLVLEVAGGG